MKKIYSLFAILAFTVASFAQTVEVEKEYIFADIFGSATIQPLGTQTLDEFFTIEAQKNSSTSQPAYWNSGDLRIYDHKTTGNGNSFTISTANQDVVIKSISFDATYPDRAPVVEYTVAGNSISLSPNNLTYLVEGLNTKSITFRNANTTATGSAIQLRFASIKIKFEKPDNTASTKDNNIVGLAVYPNPATDVLHITTPLNAEKDVTIFDMLGKVVLKTKTQQTVNVNSLSPGVYLVKIVEQGKSSTQKVVIK